MKNILEGLDAGQTQAVLHGTGPAIVLAGPGAGKTKALTTRAAYLVQQGVRPESILLLTFTRESSSVMMRRAAGLDERCRYLSGGTFHSVASTLVNENHRALGSDREFTVLDKDDAIEYVKKAMVDIRGDEKNWPRANAISKVISFAANTRCSIEDSMRAKMRDKMEFLESVKKVAKAYRQIKLASHMIDYDDLLLYMALMLEHPQIGPVMRARWKYCLFDEYQDTNALQLRIVYGLAGNNQNVMVVGDPSQAIYAFRGAAPATMVNFRTRFLDAKVIVLDTNYRSSPEIVKIVNVIDKSMKLPFDRNLVSARPSGPRPVIVDVADPAAEAMAIADSILDHKAEGGEISDHAILVRSTVNSRRIETEFITRRIPYKVRGGVRVDEAQHVKDLLSIARLTVNTRHEPAWLRMVGRFPKIGAKAAGDITSRLVKAESLGDAIDILAEEGTRRRTDLSMLGTALERMALTPDPADALTAAMETMTPLWSQFWVDDWASRHRDLEAVILIAHEHATLDRFLTAVTIDVSFAKEGSRSDDRDDEAPVTISTIHSAKGLEWPIVHVPYFVMGGMPSFMAKTDEDEAEEKRVFYVACSRPERVLRFYKPLRGGGAEAFTTPSRFEGLIAPHVDREKYVREMDPVDGPLETDAVMDLKSMLEGEDL